MRLKTTKSGSATSLYVIKDVYIDGKRTTKITEKLGTVESLGKTHDDPIAWAKAYIVDLNDKEREETEAILVKLSPAKQIDAGIQKSFNGGYLFLQKLYHEVGLDSICSTISARHMFKFDLNEILSRLLYARIMYPSSKLATFELSKIFIEQPQFELHQMYRALDVIAKETDFIQAQLYKNTAQRMERDTSILYYDCTNYFFEIEQEEGLKQYGKSKENRPNPIVQMGLFMDANGMPLAFNITSGNTNEQVTMKPLEQKILKDFELSKFVVCTDAGLASNTNRLFNATKERRFITTHSLKKSKKYIKDWALATTGWRLSEGCEAVDLRDIDRAFALKHDLVFYKERLINDGGLEQKIIVSFSVKYEQYQANIRNEQIARAIKKMNSHPTSIGKVRANDFKRFIKTHHHTGEGEVAANSLYTLDEELIIKESQYDGLYAVATNLEDDISTIIKANKSRWQIEECFRIMKSEFKARPVYLKRDERIGAHFTTCFLSLLLFRGLEQRLDNNYSPQEIIHTLQNMNFFQIKGEGYIPTYMRSDLTDNLHDAFGFRTDREINKDKEIKNIIKHTKKRG
ncbi:IS4 family transposase [Erysipelotrichaceae bacterium]|nr:IS4 family transposase [Erysipelotrichaceae bacterium]